MAQHCPECGFVNDEGANYCQRCGAAARAQRAPTGESVTATYRIDETGELIPVEIERGHRPRPGARDPRGRRARGGELPVTASE